MRKTDRSFGMENSYKIELLSPSFHSKGGKSGIKDCKYT